MRFKLSGGKADKHRQGIQITLVKKKKSLTRHEKRTYVVVRKDEGTGRHGISKGKWWK